MIEHIYKERVHDEKSALLYAANCQLATVSDLAMKKSRGKWDYERQIKLAQNLVDWIHEFKIEVDKGNRVADIMALPSRSVKEWAEQYEPERKS